jgi:hypothetical protein
MVLEDPNAITLISLAATMQLDGSVLVEWETATEWNQAGFNLYRVAPNGELQTPINAVVVASEGVQGQGATYSFTETNPPSGTWEYWLEAVDIFGDSTPFGPVSLVIPTMTAVGLESVETSTTARILPLLAVVGLVGTAWLLRRRRVR